MFSSGRPTRYSKTARIFTQEDKLGPTWRFTTDGSSIQYEHFNCGFMQIKYEMCNGCSRSTHRWGSAHPHVLRSLTKIQISVIFQFFYYNTKIQWSSASYVYLDSYVYIFKTSYHKRNFYNWWKYNKLLWYAYMPDFFSLKLYCHFFPSTSYL